MSPCYLASLLKKQCIKKFEDIICYKISSELSDYIWEIINNWKWFEKTTIGNQFIRSIDSVGANIAEGFGRYHKKDKIKFYYTGKYSFVKIARVV